MARSRRRVFGRSLALLALGIALGVGLFLARHLRPAALKLQVREALEEVFLAPFEFDDVILDLNTGIELRGLRVLYDDDLAAIEAERVALTVDHQRLLNGEVIIRQVDVDGLVVRLRPDLSGAPGLPGVLRPPAEDSSSTAAPPLIRLRSGTTGSAIELHDLNWMRGSAAIRIECQTAEGHADGPLYVVNGSFSGEHIGRLSLRLRYDEPNQTLDLAAEANDMAWTREFWQKFSPETLAMLPPVETAGSASATGSARFLLAPWRLDHCRVDGELKGLEGAFGNIHTGEREGLPFAISQGGARLSYEDGVITMRDFAADYVSPGGRVGQLKAKLDLDLTRVEPHLDLKLNARGMRVETDDLRKLLPPQVVSAVIEQFLPGGTFNFDLAISQRPALPESVSLDLRIEDGHLNYAGEFDELTGRRFGFRYPLSRCRGHLVIDTNIPTPHGWADRVVIHGIDGYNPIARPRPEGPSDVAVHAKGRVVTYATAEGEPKRDEIAIDIDAKNLPIDAKLATAFASTPDGTPYEKFDLTGWAKTVAIRVRRDAFSDDPRARATYDVELVDCAIAYEAFPLRLRKISGRILSREPPPDENGVSWRTLEMKDMHGEADGGGTFTANGLVRQDDRGTDELTLAIGAKGLVLGPELDECLDAAPIIGEELRRLWRRLDPSGTVDAELTFRSPTDP
ncbi:MAG: hypothetical protein OER88_03390, partial [Planctomycetota bacterium]|nr:hypothetical protein [Planctomycetota bacterium]